MSQQGGRPTGHEDDWWRELYDDSTDDTGPAPARDSLDDRFASASGAVGEETRERGGSPNRPAARPFGAEPVVPAPRTGADDVHDPPPAPGPPRPRAPWEPPTKRPTGPVSFPAAQQPPRHTDRTATGSSPDRPDQPPAPPAPDARTPRVPPPPTDPPAWPAPDTAAEAPVPPRPAAPPPAVPQAQDAPPAPARPAEQPSVVPQPDDTPSVLEPPVPAPGARGYVGTRPPTYDAEPTALPAADPDDLDDLVADTVLDGARYGACTVRAVSLRGDSARYRGEPRRDALLMARFGGGDHALLLVAMATGARATPGAHRAAAEACHWIGRAVGRSHARLVEDIRDGRRGDLKSGLHRLTDRSLGKLRASASEQGVAPEEYAASLRCLLLPADPRCRTRVFFGVGPGGLFRLREGEWQDIEPQVAEVKGEPVLGFGSPPSETPEGDRLTMDLGIPTPPSPYEPAPEPPREPFRFRTSVARPGDTLLMCSGGLADPLHGEPDLGEYLAERWSRPEPPGLAAFLADSQVRVKGYADDRTAAAVWEA
ncbi:protein phosphatase 2C domain-containing protein [Streptomyces sp. NPDC059696]|uniref:protein phosphatase 2C domain-containing protein n=1 Tax=Streptomyces sp. NPDC059696 TaxID=3346911 RepID=UPI0036CAB3E9